MKGGDVLGPDYAVADSVAQNVNVKGEVIQLFGGILLRYKPPRLQRFRQQFGSFRLSQSSAQNKKIG